MMRKLALAGAAGVLIGASAVAALGSLATPSVTATQAADHLSAGSPQHPQGVRLTAGFGWQGLSPASQPIVTHLDLWFPRGSLYNGARYKTCSLRVLNALGPSGCPKTSIMGTGSGAAYADTVITRPKITVVNGGARTVYFYTVLNNPARVQTPVVGRLTHLKGDFAYHLSVPIPRSLQVVAGIPIRFTSLQITAGRGNWLSLTAPPSGFKAVVTFSDGETISAFVSVHNV